jgi:hypothetical protein
MSERREQIQKQFGIWKQDRSQVQSMKWAFQCGAEWADANPSKEAIEREARIAGTCAGTMYAHGKEDAPFKKGYLPG